MTPAEAALWEALRNRQLGGLRFRTQHPVGPFILDFYCPAHRLAIEVDGGIHDIRAEQDADRTAHLESYGIRVLRFRNEQVLSDLPSVLRRILETISVGIGPPSPPILGGAEFREGPAPPRIGGLGGSAKGGGQS